MNEAKPNKEEKTDKIEEYKSLATNGDITLVKELKEMFAGSTVVKDQVEGARHKSHTIQQVENKVIETLKKEDKDKKWWYHIDNYSVGVYKDDVLVRTVLVPKHYFDETEAGTVSVMSPEQRVVSQMTYAQREALRLAFFIRTSFDPEAEYAHELNKRDQLIESYKKRIEAIEGADKKDDARIKINQDERLDTEQKKELIALVQKRPDTAPKPDTEQLQPNQ